jgi:uncharacterized protein (TIGR02246 family)
MNHDNHSTPTAPGTPAEVPVHFDAAFNRGDVAAVLAVFNAPSTMRMTDGQVVEQDPAALEQALTQLLSQRPQVHNKVRRVLACDDIALVLMDWTFIVKTSDGETQNASGTATQVMQRQADGTWRLKISNPLGVA